MKRQKSAGGGGPKGFYLALAAIVLVGGGILAWQLARPKDDGVRLLADVGPAQAEGYLYGKPDAPVQVLEFADFQCPACERYATLTGPDVKRRLADAGLVSIRFYDFPLPMHRNAVQASNAAACASDQGKFWEMHDRIFEGQPDWAEQRNPKGTFRGYARQVGVDAGQWEECYDSGKHVARIQANKAEGERRGVNSTPTFVIGRRMIPGALSYDTFKAYVDSALAESRPAAAGAGTTGSGGAAPPAGGARP